MKIPLALSILFAFALVPVGAAADDLVTVTLDVNLAALDYAECDVQVPEGADGGAVLDAAVEAGCISQWSGTEYDFGTFVDCIDHVCGTLPTFWLFSVNGEDASFGIDLYEAAEGDVVGFTYTQWVLPLP